MKSFSAALILSILSAILGIVGVTELQESAPDAGVSGGRAMADRSDNTLPARNQRVQQWVNH